MNSSEDYKPESDDIATEISPNRIIAVKVAKGPANYLDNEQFTAANKASRSATEQIPCGVIRDAVWISRASADEGIWSFDNFFSKRWHRKTAYILLKRGWTTFGLPH